MILFTVFTSLALQTERLDNKRFMPNKNPTPKGVGFLVYIDYLTDSRQDNMNTEEWHNIHRYH